MISELHFPILQGQISNIDNMETMQELRKIWLETKDNELRRAIRRQMFEIRALRILSETVDTANRRQFLKSHHFEESIREAEKYYHPPVSSIEAGVNFNALEYEDDFKSYARPTPVPKHQNGFVSNYSGTTSSSLTSGSESDTESISTSSLDGINSDRFKFSPKLHSKSSSCFTDVRDERNSLPKSISTVDRYKMQHLNQGFEFGREPKCKENEVKLKLRHKTTPYFQSIRDMFEYGCQLDKSPISSKSISLNSLYDEENYSNPIAKTKASALGKRKQVVRFADTMSSDEQYEEDGVDIDEIEDEETLIELLDETEDIDERKRIRNRLRQVQFEIKAKRAEMLKKVENEREMAIRKRLKDAEEQKKRTLQMYSDMAKSAPAGGAKIMNVGIYKNSDDNQKTVGVQKQDLVEDAIRLRQKECDDRKKRLLAAYDDAAKSAPAGAEKVIKFNEFIRADVTDFKPATPVGGCTFGMSGGVPQVRKGSVPSTPTTGGPPQFPKPGDESHLDPMERAIRQRQREADERKKRTLMAYDIAAKTGGGGPKMIYLEEFRNLNVSDSQTKEQAKLPPKYSSTSCFMGGIHQGSRR